MKRFVTHIFFAAVIAFFCVNLAGIAPACPADSPPVYSLDDLQKNPEAFLGTTVKLILQFDSFGKFYSPFYTRFVPEHYLNLSVWDDNKDLWIKEDYKKAFSFVYISKKSLYLKDILNLKRFARLEASVIVQSTFNKTPWIEIMEVEVLKKHLTQESIKQITKGLKLVEEAKYADAYSELNIPRKKNSLPERIQMFLAKNQGICAYHIGKYKRARELLQEAYSFYPKDKELEEYLEKALQAESLLKEKR